MPAVCRVTHLAAQHEILLLLNLPWFRPLGTLVQVLQKQIGITLRVGFLKLTIRIAQL